MSSIKEHCTPRQDLLSGTFNPEIFTPSLVDVLDFYRGKSNSDTIYTDANAFFREATFPSAGLALLTRQVFRRLKGERDNPATHRLETAFGGGKTHALIALAHLSQKGSSLQETVSDWIPDGLLPDPGEVKLVGIVGESLKVADYRGPREEPWTLWREIAFQIDPNLADEPWARSDSAPERDGPWFQNVLAYRKVLLLIDELALYMTRLSAVRPDAPAQAAAFLKTVFDQRHSSSNLVTVLTLAGLKDAFSRQTEAIRKALADASGKELDEISQEVAEQAMDRSTRDIESVVKRDEAGISIVAPEELAQIFAKRLFERIDRAGAEAAAAAFMDAYARSADDLSNEATSEKMRERMVQNYPFHPTLIDFLYNKLSSVEHFQGTRGVLQTMSVVIHRIWSEKDQDPVMIQVGDIDLRGARVNDMILGRTRSLDLEPALSTDIGGKGQGEEHAARLDRENPNPSEPRWHEKVWRVVFLNSLADRSLGLQSKLFGITESDALLQAVHPGLGSALVKKALEAIKERAWFLKFREGVFYCDLSPTVTRIVGSVREKLRGADADRKVSDEIVGFTRRLLKESYPFKVYDARVKEPSDLPDGQEGPTLVVVDHAAGEISIRDFFTQTGRGARSHQNPLIFLVPDSVTVSEVEASQKDLFEKKRNLLGEIEEMTRDVLARRQIKAQPEKHQLSQRILQEEDFETDLRERESVLGIKIAGLYGTYWYAAYETGDPVSVSHTATGPEGGLDIFPEIEKRLKDRNKLVDDSNARHRSFCNQLMKLFFSQRSILRLKDVAESFWKNRKWPMLAEPAILEVLVREGIREEQWVLVYQNHPGDEPSSVFWKKNDLPLTVSTSDLWEDGGYSIVAVSEAMKRGWLLQEKEVDTRELIQQTLSPDLPATFEDFQRAAKKQLPAEVQNDEEVKKHLRRAIESGTAVMIERDSADPDAKPTKIIDRNTIGQHDLDQLDQENLSVVSIELAQRLGWQDPEVVQDTYFLDESHFDKVHPKLPRLGTWSRGMKGRFSLEMESVKLRARQSRISLMVEGLDESGFDSIQELLEVFAANTEPDEEAIFSLKLTEAAECPFVKKLKEEIGDA